MSLATPHTDFIYIDDIQATFDLSLLQSESWLTLENQSNFTSLYENLNKLRKVQGTFLGTLLSGFLCYYIDTALREALNNLARCASGSCTMYFIFQKGHAFKIEFHSTFEKRNNRSSHVQIFKGDSHLFINEIDVDGKNFTYPTAMGLLKRGKKKTRESILWQEEKEKIESDLAVMDEEIFSQIGFSVEDEMKESHFMYNAMDGVCLSWDKDRLVSPRKYRRMVRNQQIYWIFYEDNLMTFSEPTSCCVVM